MHKPLKDLETILQKEMSRKEFLRVAAAAMLAMVGVTGLLQNLSKLSGTTQTTRTLDNRAGGYGNSAYGR